jgi:hypothetical protein
MHVFACSSSKSFSAFQQVLSSPLYRSATIAMFLSGIGSSAAVPQIILFLVKELGTPLPIAELYYLTSLATVVRILRFCRMGWDRTIDSDLDAVSHYTPHPLILNGSNITTLRCRS